ncbi:MAG: ABC transporter transmembrane domain-containing protein [Luteibacter sp.]|uniref:peptidase domain-containing ABC transporter n=1 Tax=Luteibacter sp. TaxID=1886636 RepID=UPI0028067F94|nr:ABC transporter transmembrane domain-containing protein [Luteibacter sp.]MDQ7995215.1 ABC transporter transmembrane domain-containing protein [Luteibacter sp.]
MLDCLATLMGRVGVETSDIDLFRRVPALLDQPGEAIHASLAQVEESFAVIIAFGRDRALFVGDRPVAVLTGEEWHIEETPPILPPGRRVFMLQVRPQPADPPSGRRWWRDPAVRRAGRLGRTLPAVLALSIALEVCAILTPLQMQWVIDEALPANDNDLILWIAAGFFALGFFQALLAVARATLINWAGTRIGLEWTLGLFHRTLRQPLSYFSEHSLGEIVSAYAAQQTVMRSMTSTLIAGIFDGLVALVVVAVMLWFSVKLSLVVMGSTALYAVARALYLPVTRARRTTLVSSAAEQQTDIVEAARGALSLRTNSLEGWALKQFEAHSHRVAALGLRSQDGGSAFSQFATLLASTQRTVVVSISATLVLHSSFTIGMMVAFLGYADQFSQRIGALIDRLSEIAGLRPSIDAVRRVAGHPSAPQRLSGRMPEGYDLALNGTSFVHGNGHAILNDIVLHVPRGDVVGIVGASGAGKTTLLQLVHGLLVVDPSMKLGGVAMTELEPSVWRSAFAAVYQEDTLLTGSIANNICGFSACPDEQRMIQAAQAACIHDEIGTMENGYHRRLNGAMPGLSAGQRQRILLARALYRRCPILLLDEATSNLSTDMEACVMTNICATGATILFVSHRRGPLRFANRVFEIAGGALRDREADPSD